MEVNFEIYEDGTNKLLGEFTMKPETCPRVGEFFIMDTVPHVDWKEKMYVVTAVTSFLPKEGETSGLKAIHVQKYDYEKAQSTEERLREIMSRLNKGVQNEKADN